MISENARWRTSFSGPEALRRGSFPLRVAKSSYRTTTAACERFITVYRGLAGIETSRSHRASSASRSPKSSGPNKIAGERSIGATRCANSFGGRAIRRNFFSLVVAIPVVPATRSTPRSAAPTDLTVRAASRMSTPCTALFRASSPIGHGSTRTRRRAPKFFIARATAPTFPSFFGPTRTTTTSRIRGRPRAGVLYNTWITRARGPHRDEDRVRRDRVPRTGPPAGAQNGGGRGNPRASTSPCDSRPASRAVPEREPDGSRSERPRECRRVRRGPRGGRHDSSLQRKDPGGVGMVRDLCTPRLQCPPRRGAVVPIPPSADPLRGRPQLDPPPL